LKILQNNECYWFCFISWAPITNCSESNSNIYSFFIGNTYCHYNHYNNYNPL